MIDWCWCVDVSDVKTNVEHQKDADDAAGENLDLKDRLVKALCVTEKDDKKSLAADAIYWNEYWNSWEK